MKTHNIKKVEAGNPSQKFMPASVSTSSKALNQILAAKEGFCKVGSWKNRCEVTS